MTDFAFKNANDIAEEFKKVFETQDALNTEE